MEQNNLYHFLSPDFVNVYHRSLFCRNDGDLALVIPVFYNSKVDLSIPYNGIYDTIRGSEFDLMSHLGSRFSGRSLSVHKFKVDDIFFLRSDSIHNIISPVDDNLLCSGLFKFFILVYLSK